MLREDFSCGARQTPWPVGDHARWKGLYFVNWEILLPPLCLALAKTAWPGEGTVGGKQAAGRGTWSDVPLAALPQLAWSGSLTITAPPPLKLIALLWSSSEEVGLG